MVYGVWCMVYDLCYLVYQLRFMVYDTGCMVHLGLMVHNPGSMVFDLLVKDYDI